LLVAGYFVQQQPHAGGLELNGGIVQQSLNFVQLLLEILLGHCHPQLLRATVFTLQPTFLSA